MNKTYTGILIAHLFISSALLKAQDGSLDPSFIQGAAANLTVNLVKVLPSGKVFAAGMFSSFAGTPAQRIVRLLPNGAFDPSFVASTTGMGADGDIRSMAYQPDGKIVLGGIFTNFAGNTVGRIVRLDTNGAVDPGFSPTSGASNEVTGIEVQADGRILISGFFNNYNGQPFNGFLRLMPNGSVDTSFLVGNGSNIFPNDIKYLSNGNILIGGSHTSYQGTPINRITRLQPNGLIDPSFVPANIPSGSINVIEVQTDGKIIIAGTFSSVGGINMNRLARLLPDGQLDTTFQVGSGLNSTVRTLYIQPDGRIVVAGDFTLCNGVSRARIARFNTDGSLDLSFDPGTGTNGTVYSISAQADNKLIIGGAFTIYDNVSRLRICRINNSGCIPAVSPMLSASKNQISCGDTVVLYAGGQLNNSIQWQWYDQACGAIPLTTGDSITIILQQTSTFFAAGEGGCQQSGPCSSIQIQVIDTIPPVPDLSILPPLMENCGFSVTSTPTASDNCDGTIMATTLSPTAFYAPGSYQILWNYHDSHGNTSSQVQDVYITGLDLSVTILSGSPDTLLANYQSPTAIYSFWLCVGNSKLLRSTGADPYFICPAPGDYALSISDQGCSDTSACYSLLVTHRKEPEIVSGFHISPNPNRGIATVESSNASIHGIRMFNLQGRKVFEVDEIMTTQYQLDVSAYSSGMYLLMLLTEVGPVVLKLIRD